MAPRALEGPTAPRVGSHRWGELDGLRAAALLVVLAVHAEWSHVQGGLTSVDVFFVLSGFLITDIALREHDARGGIAFGYFYARRALRLLPALGLAIALAVGLTAAGLAHGQGRATIAGIPFVAFYLGDYARAFGPSSELGTLGATWSLAVEEQFYLVWPAVLVVLLRLRMSRRAIAGVLLAAAVGDEAWRGWLVHLVAPTQRYAFSADARCDGLLVGCAVAFLFSAGALELGRARRAALYTAGAFGGVVSLYVVVTGSGTNPYTFAFGVPVVVWSTAALLCTIVAAPVGGVSGVLGARPLRWLGRRSYAVYLYHYPLFVALGAPGGSVLRVAIAVALTVAAAAASGRYVEDPALRYARRFRPAKVADGEVPVTLGAALGAVS